jgi:hypothetical protein
MAHKKRSIESTLEQVFWFLLFVGWIPMLASYAYLLDPIAVEETGVFATVTDKMTLYEQRGWGHPAVGVLTIIGLISGVLIFVLKQRYLWPIPLFLLWSSQIYVFNEVGSGASLELSVHIVYAILAFASTYLFLRHGHLLSGSFVCFIALLLLDVGVSKGSSFVGFGSEISLIGWLFDGYVPSLVNALLFTTISILVRMVWLMVRDNRHFLQSMSRPELRTAFFHTFRLWFPAPLVFMFFGIFWWSLVNIWVQPTIVSEIETENAMLKDEVEKLIRANHGGRYSDMGPPEDFVQREFRDHDGAGSLEREIIRRSELYSLEYLFRSLQVVTNARRNASDNIDELPDYFEVEINRALPEDDLPLLDVPKWCFIIDFACKIEQSFKSSANDTMRDARSALIEETTNMVAQKSEEADGKVGEALSAIEAELKSSSEIARDKSEASIAGGFRTWRNVSLLVTLYSLIILLKTLLIVFSRVILAPKDDENTVARFLPDDVPEGMPNLKRHKQTYVIPTSEPNAHFVARWGVTLEGPPPARRRPLGFSLPLARILSGTWVMNRIDGNRDSSPDEFDAELKVDEPAELVSWTLREGERVVFRFSDFVGMSETLTVGRISSLGITTLVLGRMIFHYAEGPGVLILRTTAAARLGPSSQPVKPAPMPKLVAWGSSTRFSIFAALTMTDTFLSGYNMKTSKNDAVVWDTSTRRGDGPGTGIIRFLKNFILPI